jgi:L-ascorbate metabolism protein UlaG (beta-lactamase superfamily)
VLATGFLKARINIPMHYGTFDVIRADPQEFVRRVEAAGRKAVVIHPGTEYTIE